MAKTKRVKPAVAIAIEASSGNVFQDLGMPDAGERLAKAELARVVRYIIAGKQWTQRRAADELGIAPPDVSDLMRGKLARFSQERLERSRTPWAWTFKSASVRGLSARSGRV